MDIRKAMLADLDEIEAIYEDAHTQEELGLATTGWERGVYPVRATAEAAIEVGSMFVAVEAGEIVASAKIDQNQVPEYANANWQVDAPAEKVMVLHTLVVSSKAKGKGVGTAMVKFYEYYALKHECPHLRMDTNEINKVARAMYQKLGYAEAGIVDCVFNGIPGVHLVCLEKNLWR